MKTNLINNQNAVITSDNGDVIGIIQCTAGKHNIEDKLIIAITEHECTKEIKINKITGDLNEFDHVASLFVTLYYEGEWSNRLYYVELTTTY